MDKKLKINFMGTPAFAVPSLEILINSGYEIGCVITAPDKPAGRGKKIQQSEIKIFAQQHNLKILQPENLKDKTFIDELKNINSDLQVVVAFRMLPELVWKMPVRGTFNLHASLLPQYRGAAPINWAIINGETETGVTTFFLDKEIDTGNIIFQEKLSIGDSESAGELHNRLMIKGAELVLKTVRAIEYNNYPSTPQDTLVNPDATEKAKQTYHKAPKIFKEDCEIFWNKNAADILNLIRGLSPVPGAFTFLKSPDGETILLKIFSASLEPPPYFTKSIILQFDNKITQGLINTDGKSFLSITAHDNSIFLNDVQIAGKKRMNIEEFLRGFRIDNSWQTT